MPRPGAGAGGRRQPELSGCAAVQERAGVARSGQPCPEPRLPLGFGGGRAEIAPPNLSSLNSLFVELVFDGAEGPFAGGFG
jgi:hypothetical protein